MCVHICTYISLSHQFHYFNIDGSSSSYYSALSWLNMAAGVPGFLLFLSYEKDLQSSINSSLYSTICRCDQVYMITSNETVFNKNRVIIGLPQKGQKQVYDLQRNALSSLGHFAVQLHKVD